MCDSNSSITLEDVRKVVQEVVQKVVQDELLYVWRSLDNDAKITQGLCYIVADYIADKKNRQLCISNKWNTDHYYPPAFAYLSLLPRREEGKDTSREPIKHAAVSVCSG